MDIQEQSKISSVLTLLQFSYNIDYIKDSLLNNTFKHEVKRAFNQLIKANDVFLNKIMKHFNSDTANVINEDSDLLLDITLLIVGNPRFVKDRLQELIENFVEELKSEQKLDN